MNIFGRVFGGLLVLISLGWLATIVGIRPGWFGNNQINSVQPPATNNLTTNPAVGTVPSGNSPVKNQASSFGANNSGVKASPNSAASPKPEVEKDPRSAATPQPDKAVPQTAPAAPAAPQSAPAAAAPVSAGW
jgi:hypothetical protein